MDLLGTGFPSGDSYPVGLRVPADRTIIHRGYHLVIVSVWNGYAIPMIEMSHALEALSRAGLRRTPQRIAVIEALIDNRSHPTVEMVWARVREAMPSVSLSTVYGTLRELESLGLLSYVSQDPLRVDPDVAVHAHLSCATCGRVIDVPEAGAIEAVRLQAEHLGHTVEKVGISVSGVCGDCRRQGRHRVAQA